MSYDEQSQMHGQTVCTAKANSPYQQTREGVLTFLDLGIPARMLVLGVPWYGYVYPCTVLLSNVCRIESRPFRGCKCSDAAGREYRYQDIMKKANEHRAHIQWDNLYRANFFNYYQDRQWHQVWFDDTKSLRPRYDLAKELGMGGVGMWSAGDLDYENATQVDDFWGAIPRA